MKRLPAALLVVAIAWTTVPRAGAMTQTSDKAAAQTVLIENERKVNESLARGDKAAFLALVAEEGVWASGGSFIPVSQFANALDQIEVTKWDIVNAHVLWADPATAVLIYVRTGAGRIGDRTLAPNLLASTVWTKRGDKWIAVYHQESDAVAGQ